MERDLKQVLLDVFTECKYVLPDSNDEVFVYFTINFSADGSGFMSAYYDGEDWMTLDGELVSYLDYTVVSWLSYVNLEKALRKITPYKK